MKASNHHFYEDYGADDDEEAPRPPPPPRLLSSQSYPLSHFRQYGSIPQQDTLAELTSNSRVSHLRGSVLYRASVTSTLVGMDFLDELDDDAAAAAAAGVLSIIPDNNWTRAERPLMVTADRTTSFRANKQLRHRRQANLMDDEHEDADDEQDHDAPKASSLPKDIAWLSSKPTPSAINDEKKEDHACSHHHHFEDTEFFDHHCQNHHEFFQGQKHVHQPRRQSSILRPSITKEEIFEELEEATGADRNIWDRLTHMWTLFMFHGVLWDDDGMPYFEEDLDGSAFSNTTSPSVWFRFLVFNPIYPEFTSLQQSCWAVIIGVTMGVFTALWQKLIESCVEFLWKTVPEFLLRHNVLTDLNGSFPLPYYIVLCPALMGCVMSYINVILPTTVPGQNEWIQDTHNQGVMDASAFWHLFFMSTAAMASGLSLGPELPLVLLGGMYGSWLGVLTKQSVLQARVMNLTAGSAIVSGFFGFPMAGGLFILELPHRMGLQYFEALTPATVSSIVAVITNRMVNGNDVTGYYHYPFMTLSLPSRIFVSAIVYGAFGSLVGVLYGKGVTWLKHDFHELFHHHETHSVADDVAKSVDTPMAGGEETPLVGGPKVKSGTTSSDFFGCCRKKWQFTIPHEPTRAAVVGTICGTLVGITGLYLPHIMFWGEAQLQTLIDQGRTPLPIFGKPGEPTADMTAYGFCLVDPADPKAVEAGFSLGCSALITFAKIWSTGVSLGTGIVAGQFWGPLFTGCAAAQFFTAFVNWTQTHFGFGGWLAAHPCVAILCIMGSSHVVTFRTHSAITLILTLTISSFDAGGEVKQVVAGDYSAVFPLLVVAVYVSFILARDYVFYKAQRARGDILALPEVLCEPGKLGRPLVVQHTDDFDDPDYGVQSINGDLKTSDDLHPMHRESNETPTNETAETSFIASPANEGSDSQSLIFQTPSPEEVVLASPTAVGGHRRSLSVPLIESTNDAKPLLARSGSFDKKPLSPRPPSPGGRNLVRVSTYGEVTDHQPSLLDQARATRSTASDLAEMQHHRRYPSLPKISTPAKGSHRSVSS